MFSTRNDLRSEMIPVPEMIPKLCPQWSPGNLKNGIKVRTIEFWVIVFCKLIFFILDKLVVIVYSRVGLVFFPSLGGGELARSQYDREGELVN